MIIYTIQDGDSLESIALANAMNVEDLLLANPQLKGGYLPGTVITIPEFAAMVSNMPGDLYFIKDGKLVPGSNELINTSVISNYEKPWYKKGLDIVDKYVGKPMLAVGDYINDEVLLNKDNVRVKFHLDPRNDQILADVKWGGDVAGSIGLAALGMYYNPFATIGAFAGGYGTDRIVAANTPYSSWAEYAENELDLHPMIARYTDPGAIIGGAIGGGVSTAGPGGFRGFVRGGVRNLRAAAKNPEIEAANMDMISTLPVWEREPATMAYAKGLRSYRGAGVSSKTKGSRGDIYHTTYKSPTSALVSRNISSGYAPGWGTRGINNFGRHSATTGYQAAPGKGVKINFTPEVPYTPIYTSPGYMPYITTTPWHPPVIHPNIIPIPEEHLEQTRHKYGPNWEKAYSKLPEGAVLDWPGDEYSPAGTWIVNRSGKDIYRTSDANITTNIGGKAAGYEIQPSVKVYPVDSALKGVRVTRLPGQYTPTGPVNGNIIIEQ